MSQLSGSVPREGSLPAICMIDHTAAVSNDAEIEWDDDDDDLPAAGCCLTRFLQYCRALFDPIANTLEKYLCKMPSVAGRGNDQMFKRSGVRGLARRDMFEYLSTKTEQEVTWYVFCTLKSRTEKTQCARVILFVFCCTCPPHAFRPPLIWSPLVPFPTVAVASPSQRRA